MFSNRIQAGQLLAKKLTHFQNARDTLVMAIPNGGVMTGFVVAKALNLPLEVEFIKRMVHPDDATQTIGAVSQYGRSIRPDCGITESYLEVEVARIRKILEEQHNRFMKGREVLEVRGKTIILVDDGIATGQTMRQAIQLIKSKKPEKVIVATPLAPLSAKEELKKQVDEFICLESPDPFEGIKAYYRQFHPVKDITIIRLLKGDTDEIQSHENQ